MSGFSFLLMVGTNIRRDLELVSYFQRRELFLWNVRLNLYADLPIYIEAF
jgi:hypothetical protein